MNRMVMSIGCMLALLVIILVLSRAVILETFDNTGALMNLNSTRVLTASEARAERKAYAEQVARDLANMTE